MPRRGACGGQFTANTMAMSGEMLGISPMQLSGVPATDKDKHAATREAGRMLMEAVRANRRPSQIITKTSIVNTIASVAASGGSTNAVLHLLAIAREVGIQLSIDDFDAISKKTPSFATWSRQENTWHPTSRQRVDRACWLSG